MQLEAKVDELALDFITQLTYDQSFPTNTSRILFLSACVLVLITIRGGNIMIDVQGKQPQLGF